MFLSVYFIESNLHYRNMLTVVEWLSTVPPGRPIWKSKTIETYQKHSYTET